MPSSLLGSWIDLDAATNTARQLCTPLERTPAEGTSVPPNDDDSAEEIPSAHPPPALQRRLVDIRGRAERNGLLAKDARTGPTAPPQGPQRPDDAQMPGPFRVPFGPLTARVRALADWVQDSFAPASLFVADDQGQPLVEFCGGGDLLAAAAVLADAVQRARRHLPEESGAEVVHLTLAPDQILSLISTPTPLGVWQAGLTTASPLDHQTVRSIIRALKNAAGPG